MKLIELPELMTAVELTGYGGPEKLSIRDDIPIPEIKEEDVLIEVAACGMNNTDINTRVGWYSKSITTETSNQAFEKIENKQTWGGESLFFPRIQGANPCGIVVAIGKNVDPTYMGKRVLVDPWIRDLNSNNWRGNASYLGSEINGGFAQYCLVPARNAYPITSKMTDIELASFACAWSTAEHMLTRSKLLKNQNIVITGASGGVGTALIQLAKLRGAQVIAITTREKFDLVKECGADFVLDRREKTLSENIIQVVKGTVDVLADVVGGPDFVELLETLTRGGRYVTAGAIAGPIVDLDLRTLYLNDLELYGCTIYEPAIFKKLIEHIEKNRVRPLVSKVFELREIKKAQEEFSKKEHVGSMVLSIG